MAQTSKAPISNVVLKRRDYLRKKSSANVLAWSIGCVTVCLALLATFIGIPLGFIAIVLYVRDGFPALSNIIIAGLVSVASLCGLAVLSSRLYSSLDQKARFIPYVPPVRDQIAALPADEILLRGSKRPALPSDDLMRPAPGTVLTDAEELLRHSVDPIEKLMEFEGSEGPMRNSASKTTSAAIYRLKITLDQIRPPIWRRVEVPGTILLPDLHRLIQVAMGWYGGHLHAFQVGETAYGEPNSDPDGWMQDERRIRLSQIAAAEKCRFRYEYDFGDDWNHTVLVEKILPAEAGKTYPVCITGKRACPPEDCGGPWGYSEFLKAISDPENEQHEELLEWIGGDFDPEAFSLEAVNQHLGGRI